MPGISIIGLFCEDIREEKAGTDSLMGILPDNLNVPGPGMIPKLALYTRFHIDPAIDPGTIAIRIDHPNGDRMMLTTLDPALIKKARDDAMAGGFPIAGLISRSGFGNFPLQAEGVIKAVAIVSGQEIVCANLKVKFVRPASGPSVSAPPAAQSPPAAPATGS